MKERIFLVDNIVFKSKAAEIVELFANSMENTSPWSDLSLRVSREGTAKTLENEFSQVRFKAVLAEEDGKIIGVSTFCYLRLEEVNDESDIFINAEQLRARLENLQEEHEIRSFVNLSRTFVDVANQGRGLATKLRKAVIEKVTDDCPGGAIIVTKHLSTNYAIIASSKSLGFQETGIKMQSFDGNFYQEYWSKIIPKRQK